MSLRGSSFKIQFELLRVGNFVGLLKTCSQLIWGSFHCQCLRMLYAFPLSRINYIVEKCMIFILIGSVLRYIPFFLKISVRMDDQIVSVEYLIMWHCPLVMTSLLQYLMNIFCPWELLSLLIFPLDFLCYFFRKNVLSACPCWTKARLLHFKIVL